MPMLFRPLHDLATRHRRLLWFLLGLGVVGLVAWLARAIDVRKFDWRLALSTIEHLDWRWLALAVVFIAATYYGRALRWAVFLKPLKPRPSMRNLLSATVIGFTATSIFGRPGEFVRPYLIAIKENVSVPSQLAAWLLERLFDLLMALLVFSFALTRLTMTGVHLGAKLGWVLAVGGRVVAVICTVVMILLVSMRHFAEPLRERIMCAIRFLPEKQFRKAESLLRSFVQGVESTRSDSALLLVLLYSAIEWALIIGCYWCLAKASPGISFLTLVDVIVLVGFVAFGSTVQIPGIGGGLQVVAVLVLTELFHLKLEVATSFAILIWIMTFVIVVPAGMALALKEGLDWRSLRRMGREEA
jgi:glycosyltransferase 2 family protein